MNKLLGVLLTILFIGLILYRFQFRIPTDLYLNPSNEQGLLFLFILLVNAIGCIILGLAMIAKSNPNSLMQEITQFIARNLKIGNKLLFNAISTKIPYYQYILAYTTKYYLKLSYRVLCTIEYIPRLVIFVTFVIMCFILFYYSSIV